MERDCFDSNVLYKNIIIKSQLDTVKALKKDKGPIVLWGAGNLGEIILDYCKKENIEISAIMVDDCGENKIIHGIKVRSKDEIESEYKVCSIVMGHSRYELGIKLEKENWVKRIYYLVGGFCYKTDYKNAHICVQKKKDDYQRLFLELEDDVSRKCIVSYINAILNRNAMFVVANIQGIIKGIFENDIIDLTERECYVDVGAYNGDTVLEFCEVTKHKYKKIIAIEPDEKNLEALRKATEANNSIEIVPKATWNEKGKIGFIDEGTQASSVTNINGAEKIVQADTLDNICSGSGITLIKINFYDGINETIDGAKDIIKNDMPNIIVTVGFDLEMVLNVQSKISSIQKKYRFFLRFCGAYPERLVLFAVI